MFKVNSKNTRTTSVIVDFEQGNFSWVRCLTHPLKLIRKIVGIIFHQISTEVSN